MIRFGFKVVCFYEFIEFGDRLFEIVDDDRCFVD